jgi:outer membrane receptor for ferrienterochelin and colicins
LSFTPPPAARGFTATPGRIRTRLGLRLTLLAVAACHAHAQDTGVGAPEPTGNQPSSVQRVEIAGRQGASDLRRAASVAKQIYGRDELDRFGDTNALDVMRRLPGVNVSSDGPRMRGLGGGYTQILINGDRAPPGFALDQLSPSQIERIEVLRAPTADQSAQAIAGTINIILKDAPRRSQRDLRLGLSSGLDRPQANLNFTWGESKGGWSVSLPVSVFEWKRENTNTTERRGPSADGAWPAVAEQVGRQEVWGHGFNAGPRVNWKISDDQDLALQTFFQKGWWNNATRFDNRVFIGAPVLDDDTRQDGTWLNNSGNLTWRYRFKNDQRIELRTGARENAGTYDAQNHRNGVNTLRILGGSRQFSATQAGKYSLLLGEAHSLTAGWDLENTRRNEHRTATLNGVALSAAEGQPFNAQVQLPGG